MCSVAVWEDADTVHVSALHAPLYACTSSRAMDPEPNTSKAASLVHSKASVVKAVPVNTSKAASLAFAKDGFPIPPVLGPCPMPQVPPPPLTQPPQFEITAGGCIGTKMPPTQPGQLFLPGAPPPPPMLLPGGPTLSPLGPPPPGPPMAPPPMDITAAELVAAVDAAMARVVAGGVPPGLGPGSEPGLLPGQLHSPVQGPPPGPPASGPAEKVEWEAHKSQQGMPYFFCRKTGESRWVKPTGPQDVIVDAKPAAKQVQAAPKAAPAASIKDRIGEPDSWETIGKTGWSRVQTDKGFTYFYHKKQKKTSWTCPPEIEKDVAELDGCLGAVEEVEESNEESNAKEDREDPERMADEVPKDDAQTEVTKPSKAERAEKRAQQVEEEQKLAKEKEKLRNFKQLLLEKGVKAFDKYEKWLPKLVHDPRFCAITGQKERKLLFDMLAKRIDSEKRKTQAVHKLKGREAFRELLTKADEMELLHGRSVERALSAMERRFGDDERWDAVAEAERERMVAEAVEEATKRVEKEKDEARAAFRALVLRTLSSLKKDGKDDAPSFSHVRRHFEGDPCWPKLGSTEREGMYSRIVRELEESRRKQRAKQRQIQLEVEEARKKRRLTESEERVFSVLAERVKNPFSLTWEEALPTLLGC